MMLPYELKNDDNPTSLTVAEQFFSVQGEGASAGVPAYFIRLKGCNLMCGGSLGKLVKCGEASWYCDTETVWKQGKKKPYEAVVDEMQDAGQLERILAGQTHIIWTGGEPTLLTHRRDILAFLRYVEKTFGGKPYNEIETNGTLEVSPYFLNKMQQVNCSPKLSNSGMPIERRINPIALHQYNQHPNAWFKFVVSSEGDVKEMQRDYLGTVGISPDKVILMPGVDKLENLGERTRFTMDMVKKYGYRMCSRLQVLAWDRTTGV